MRITFYLLTFFSFNSKAFDVEKLGDVLEQGVKQLEKELNKQQNNQPPNNINKPVQQNEQSQDTQNNIDEEKLQEERSFRSGKKKS